MDVRLPFRYLFTVRLIKLPTLATIGITNRTEDSYFLPFFDYDEVEQKVVEEDIDFFQKNFKIGSCLLLQSSIDYSKETTNVGNYHVIGLTKFTFPEIRDIIYLSRSDEHFKRGWEYQSRCWVLRIAEKVDANGQEVKMKPKLLKVVKNETDREANLAMIKFLELYYKVRLKNLFSKLDNSHNVELIEYPTR